MNVLPATLQHKIFDYCQYKTNISFTYNRRKIVVIISVDNPVFCYSYKAVLSPDKHLDFSTIKEFADTIDEFSNDIKQNKKAILPNINNSELPFLEYNNEMLTIYHSYEMNTHYYNNNFFSLKLNSKSKEELISTLTEIKEWISNKFNNGRKDCVLI